MVEVGGRCMVQPIESASAHVNFSNSMLCKIETNDINVTNGHLSDPKICFIVRQPNKVCMCIEYAHTKAHQPFHLLGLPIRACSLSLSFIHSLIFRFNLIHLIVLVSFLTYDLIGGNHLSSPPPLEFRSSMKSILFFFSCLEQHEKTCDFCY